MADADDTERAYRLLRTIAHTLGVPPDAFSRVPEPSVPSAPSADEEAELLRVFRTIRCARSRRRCLDLVGAMAWPQAGGGDDRA